MKKLLPSEVIPETKSDEIASNLDKDFLEDYDAKKFYEVFFKKWVTWESYPCCKTGKCMRASFLTELRPALIILLAVTSVI